MKWSSFKSLDIFAPSIQLNMRGEEKFQTYTGMWIALLHFAVMIAVAVSSIVSFLDNKNPVTVVENFSERNYPKVDLAHENFMPVVVGYYTETDFIRAEDLGKYVTVLVAKAKWVTYEDGSDVKVRKVIEHFDAKPCKNLNAEQLKPLEFAKKDPDYYKVLMDYGICPIVTSNFYVEGKATAEVFETIGYYIKPCTLSEGCKSADELIPVNLQFFFPNTRLNVTNFQNPIERDLYGDDLYYINQNVRQMYTIKLKHTTIMDYSGLIPDYSVKEKYYERGDVLSFQSYRDAKVARCSPETALLVDDLRCPSYMEVVVHSSSTANVIKRLYKGIPDALGVIGGTNSVLVILLSAIYLPINRRKRTRFLLESVYSLLVRDQEEIRDENAAPKINELNEKKSSICDRVVNLCKKKKKTKEEINFEENIKDALERVENSLDVCQLVNDLNLLKVISHFMFKDRHFGLAQLVGFDLWNTEKKQDQNIQNSVFLPSMRVKKIEAHERKRLGKEELKREKEIYLSMLTEVQKECLKENESLKNDPSYNPQIHSLDHFYGLHLSDSAIRLLGLKNTGFSFLEDYINKMTRMETEENRNLIANYYQEKNHTEEKDDSSPINPLPKKEVKFKQGSQSEKTGSFPGNEKYLE